MATVIGTKRLLDISGNNITTAVSLEAEGTLLDVNGASGTSGQLLSSTGTGVDWVSNNSGSWDGIFSGSAQITGSLGVTGSLEVDGNISANGAGTFGGDVTLEAGEGYRFLASTDGDQNYATFADISSVNAGMTILNDAVYLINDGNAKLTLSGSRFGIGIQTPGESLEVKSAFGQSGNILASGHISASSLISETHITASGNISGSATSTIRVGGDITGGGRGTFAGRITAFSDVVTPKILNNTSTNAGTVLIDDGLTISGNVTASKNISASGDFIGTNFTGSSFTGSFVGDGSGLTDTPINITAGTALTFTGDTLNVSTAGANLGSSNVPSSAANRNYSIQHQNNAAQTLVVNVPWTDNNTEYTAGTGLSLSAGNVFSANTAGGVLVGSSIPATVSNRYYAIQTNISDELIVNVPWTDTSWDGIFSGSAQITGSLGVTGSINATNFTGSSFTGSFVGDGSGLTGLNSGSWDGIFSGSAQITGSLGVTGSVLVDGNVGIGTTNPTTPLHIDLGTVDVKAQLDAISGFDGMLVEGTNASYNLIGGNGDKYSLSALNTGDFRIYNEGGAGYALTLNNSGKLGIGTTDPQEKLDISAGNIRLDDNLSIRWATTDANIGRVRIAGNEANDFLQFVTDNSERMRLTNTGVGIGTTSPTEKLEVNGNVKADTLIATDLTDGVIPYHRNGSFGLQDQKMFSDNTNIYIGPSSPPNFYSRLTVEGSGISTTDIEISGSLTYQEPTAASEFNGEIVTFGTFIETPAAGDLICFNNSLGTSGWREANNSFSVDSTGMLGIAVGTTPANGILLRGFARSALYNTTNLGTTPAGKKLYIDSTNGLLTTIIPTSNYVRIVGYVVEANATDGTIYFCPDNTYIDI